MQIDHVLVSQEFAAHRARFLDLADTDHRALVVDLTLHGAADTGPVPLRPAQTPMSRPSARHTATTAGRT